jgi:hypothetical protein
MQNASTAAATATEARATVDAESHVTFSEPSCTSLPAMHLSLTKVETRLSPVQSAFANIVNEPAPLLTQAVALYQASPIFVQVFKVKTRGFGLFVVPTLAVAQAVSLYCVFVTATAKLRMLIAIALNTMNFMIGRTLHGAYGSTLAFELHETAIHCDEGAATAAVGDKIRCMHWMDIQTDAVWRLRWRVLNSLHTTLQ